MRRWLWLAAAVAGILVGGAMVWKGYQRPDPVTQSSGAADIGGPFTLIDQHGQPFGDRNLKGKPSLVFFGFTYCPEVCPTTLAHMSAWLKTLGPDADRLNVVFISIDPERDTPKQLASYLSSFDPRIHGLTGTPAQVDKVADEYRVYHRKVPLPGGELHHGSFGGDLYPRSRGECVRHPHLRRARLQGACDPPGFGRRLTLGDVGGSDPLV